MVVFLYVCITCALFTGSYMHPYDCVINFYKVWRFKHKGSYFPFIHTQLFANIHRFKKQIVNGFLSLSFINSTICTMQKWEADNFVVVIYVIYVHHRLPNFKGVVDIVTHCLLLMCLTVCHLTHVHFIFQLFGILLQSSIWTTNSTLSWIVLLIWQVQKDNV